MRSAQYIAAQPGDAVLQRKLHSLANVLVITQAQIMEVVGDGKKVNGITYKDVQSGDTKQLEISGTFVQIGLVPNTESLNGAVELSRHDEVIADVEDVAAGLGAVGPQLAAGYVVAPAWPLPLGAAFSGGKQRDEFVGDTVQYLLGKLGICYRA